MWKRLCALLVCACLCVIPALPLETEDIQDPGQYLNSFLIQVDERDIAELVARDNGFVLVEKLPELDHLYHLYHPDVSGRSKRSAHDYVSLLREDSRVKFVEQQITLKRVKRDHGHVLHDKQEEFPIREIKDNSKYIRIKDNLDRRDGLGPRFNDPLYRDEWYLNNEAQTGGGWYIDLNVERAWDMGITGKGVTVSILDDGIDHEHPDLRRNYDPRASADMNDQNDKMNDPTPDKSSKANSHGTRCAGEIASEANNGICGVGIAYDAKIGGIRILDGRVTDILEAKALLYHNDIIDIYSASWGPHDDGKTMDAPKKACTDALKKGVQTGRGGRGSIFVWATGNGGMQDDNCGADGYVSSPESISIQSMSDHGEKPFFGEMCCSTMVSVPSGGEKTRKAEAKSQYKIKVVSTDLDGGCLENFEGTSSAAPLAAGCLALVLQSNPELSWRDVQHLVAREARIPRDDETEWIENGAGLHVNDKFGFGMMDCSRMVEAAQYYTDYKPAQHICEKATQRVNMEIPNSGCYNITFDFDGCHGDSNSISHLEHVELIIKLTTGRRGDIELFLTSPAGTRSHMLRRRKNDDNTEGIDFTFMTVHSWEEDPVGVWTLEVCHNPGTLDEDRESRSVRKSEGMFESWSLRTYGYQDDKPRSSGMSKKLNQTDLATILEEEFLASRQVHIKRAEGMTRDSHIEQKQKQEIDEYAGQVDNILLNFKELLGGRSLNDIYADDNNILKAYKNGYSNNEKRGYDARQMDGQNMNNDDLEVDDGEIEELKREIMGILGELDGSESQSLRNYLEEYYQQKKEEKRKRRMQELIRQLREYIKKKK